MKRRKLERWLRDHGACRDRAICEQLDVPEPRER
jgi:hypothetical protein